MAASLSALRASCTLPQGVFTFKDFWYSFLLEAELTPGPVWPEGLVKFQKSTTSGLEPTTFQLAAYCLNYTAVRHFTMLNLIKICDDACWIYRKGYL
jgi:hypothetical protein